VVVFDAVAGVEPQSETVWRQADKYRVPRICFINKMDRTGANFWRTLDMIEDRLGARPVAVQIPIGVETSFQGILDLVHQKAVLYGNDLGTDIREAPVPPELAEQAALHREALIERVAETDEALTIKYLEGTPITAEELTAALRRATIAGRLVPVLCGSALRNKGVQPMLDAVVDYLPSPVDIPPVEGINPVTGEKVIRHAREDDPFVALAFKIVSDPYVGRLAYIRVYSGMLESGSYVLNSTRDRRERVGAAAADARQPSGRDPRGVRGGYCCGGGAQADIYR